MDFKNLYIERSGLKKCLNLEQYRKMATKNIHVEFEVLKICLHGAFIYYVTCITIRNFVQVPT